MNLFIPLVQILSAHCIVSLLAEAMWSGLFIFIFLDFFWLLTFLLLLLDTTNIKCFCIPSGPVVVVVVLLLYCCFVLSVFFHVSAGDFVAIWVFNLSSCAECSDCGREEAVQIHRLLYIFKIPCFQSDYQTGICIYLQKLFSLPPCW